MFKPATVRLKMLYQQMYELTEPECRSKCHVPQSCCSPEYCGLAIETILERGEQVPITTNHPTLPFMGPTGCILKPYQRPLCTVHTCKICSMGTSGNQSWDDKYFELRNQLEEEEFAENG